MDNLMCLARLLATDSLFRVACETDLRSALTQRGLTLSKAELKAFRRVWELVADRVDGRGSFPIDWPDRGWI